MRLLESFVLLIDVPEYGLIRGQVGTIGELAPNVFLVEFSDNEGKTYELLPLEAKNLSLRSSLNLS